MDTIEIRVAKNGYIYTLNNGPHLQSDTLVFTCPLQLIQHIRETHPIDTYSFVYEGKIIEEKQNDNT